MEEGHKWLFEKAQENVTQCQPGKITGGESSTSTKNIPYRKREKNRMHHLWKQNIKSWGYISLQTVPIIGKNGSKSLIINFLSDDAST